MVFLLKPHQKNKIHDRLTQYFQTTIFVSAVLILCTLCFQLLTALQYDRMINQSMLLSHFYSDLEAQNSAIKQHWENSISNETDVTQLFEGFDELDHMVEELKDQAIGKRYTRDIGEVEKLLECLRGMLEELCEKMLILEPGSLDAVMLSEINDIYFEMEEIFELLYADFNYLQLSQLENFEYIRTKMNQITVAFVVLIVCILGLIVFCDIKQAKKLTKQVVDPILTLASSSKMILSGNIEDFERIPVQDEEDNEISILINAFNLMIEQIRRYLKEIEENANTKVALFEKEVENLRIRNQLKSSELKVLQMQINPHFLFNTLNMISQTAYVGDSETTVFLLGKTAELLRYSLGSVGKSVTLAKEISMLGCYIYLQEQRMGDRFEFEFELDERFHQIQVPGLILQPLVENSIVHGIGSYTENGKVLIRTNYDECRREGVISICDNGLGMTQERIEEIYQELQSQEMQRKKVGLANVYMRLQILYEQKVKMEIVSTPGEWTEIRLILPCDFAEKIVERR